MRFLKTAVRKTLTAFNLEASVRLQRNSGLKNEGWYSSFAQKKAIDRLSNPLPWYTYSCIHFVESRVHAGLRVFEYGAGNSTIWYGQRVKEVVSVEHDEEWFTIIKRQLPSNSMLIHRALNDGYAEEIMRHGSFDILVIDGRNRVKCAQIAMECKSLEPDGVIIWDNSDRDDFAKGLKQLREFGFREIAFEGMGPINTYNWRTSVLYRNSNCLGI